MKKLLNFVIIAVILIASVVLLAYCVMSVSKLRKDNKVLEASNSQLTDRTKQLEEAIEELKNELVLIKKENMEFKESQLNQEKDSDNPTDDIEPETDLAEEITDNIPIKLLSPDGKYMAEAYGTNKNITAGGLYPYERIIVQNIDTGEVIWEMPGGYTVEFLWSADSRYLAVNYTGRIWGECIILDVTYKKEINLPSLDTIASHFGEEYKPQDERPDPYFRIADFENSDSVKVEFSWLCENGDIFEGRFTFNFVTNEVIC